MHDHSLLGSCGAFLRSVASHSAKLVHKTGKSEKTSTSLPAATFVGMLDQIRREFRAKGR